MSEVRIQEVNKQRVNLVTWIGGVGVEGRFDSAISRLSST